MRGSSATWEQRLFAAILWTGPEAVAAGASAAALWGVPGFTAGAIEVAHTGTKQGREGVLVRRVELLPEEVTRLRGFPVTTPSRTLLDVAGRATQAQLDVALHHCLHQRLTTLADVKQLIERRAGRGSSGIIRLRAALEVYSANERPAASALEAQFARCLHELRLPRPQRQHPVRVAARRYYLDFAWPTERVAVEIDGYRWHSSRSAWESDRARLADLRRAGWTIVHATYDDVHHHTDRLLKELATLVR